MADLSIQQAFVDGINEVFEIMFTDRCLMSVLDENQKLNIYNETKERNYKEPFEVVAKIVMASTESEDAFQKNNLSAVVTLPVKQLILNEIPFKEPQDIKNLEKVRFHYDGRVLEVDSVTPKTLVADMWQMFEFKCKTLKTNVTG